MIVALALIKRSLDVETGVMVNIKEMTLHVVVFLVFALGVAASVVL